MLDLMWLECVSSSCKTKALMLWTGPARSPDLNPIEHIWDIMSRSIHQRHVAPQTVQELADALVQDVFFFQGLAWHRMGQLQQAKQQIDWEMWMDGHRAGKRSLDNKLDELRSRMAFQWDIKNCNVLVFTETWLDPFDPETPPLFSRDFSIHRQDQDN
ncbi:hypothetical protein L3Q82_016431 [Scortum barcoo]|uniref:Uncharacterized protein n=1 Tax=Scortum barcoo TaxID=214431 RepID=A0ACB8X8Z4_9TELE|nr:hypothetical protein L3Q82_016431 [Scortum barcoo]